MSVPLSVVVDGEQVLRFDRDHPLTPEQRASLQAMDRRLEEHVAARGEPLPDPVARARLVAGTLFHALERGEDRRAAACTGWLATRFPELQQVRVTRHAGRPPTIELVFDRPYAPEARVQFTPDPTKPS